MLNQHTIEGFLHRSEELGQVSPLATKLAHEKRAGVMGDIITGYMKAPKGTAEGTALRSHAAEFLRTMRMPNNIGPGTAGHTESLVGAVKELMPTSSTGSHMKDWMDYARKSYRQNANGVSNFITVPGERIFRNK